MRRTHFHLSLTLITALVVLLIALLAGTSLWCLHLMQKQAAHATAAKSIIDKGRMMVRHLAGEPVAKGAQGGNEDWGQFSRHVGSLCALDDDLQYVSIVSDGVTLFHEQRDAMTGSGASEEVLSVPPDAGVRLSRNLISVGDHVLPVVAFSVDIQGDDGKPRTVELALKRGAVEREERAEANAIVLMFRISLLTVIVSFGVCVLLVIWMIHRDGKREYRRRQEEHLAFAGVMANGIVHDFRNPMSSLRLDVQMLAKEADKNKDCSLDRLKELANRSKSTIDRMDKVFEEFLYMSGPPRDKRESIDLTACLKDCVSLLKPRLEHAGLRLDADLGGERIDVPGYQSSLNRAFLNVISNAEHFVKSGGVVSVKVSRLNGEAVVEIMDDGPGIKKADLTKIFDMFFSTRPEGTGLGLFLAKTAVARCGGTIKALNRPEGGACFRITLPLA